MYNPPHPGEILKEMYLEPLNISVAYLALQLGVSRQALSYLINCHAGISVEMAVRLAKAFATSPEFWLNLQNKYDLWEITHRKNFHEVHRVAAAG